MIIDKEKTEIPQCPDCGKKCKLEKFQIAPKEVAEFYALTCNCIGK